MNFAHETVEVSNSLGSRLGEALQRPGLAIPLVTITAFALMIVGLWLLKRFTTWQFPNLNERKK
ncbi:hypothetical protein BH10PAT3_BH10PAT3_2160 [soil metagenome]